MKKPFAKNVPWTTNYNALKKLPKNQVILFACDVARLVLPIWEQHYPEDKRPRTAIETAELFVYGQATKEQAEKARDAAFVASREIKDSYIVCVAEAVVEVASVAVSNRISHAVSVCYAANAVNAINIASNSDSSLWTIIQTIYQQTKPIAISITPILKAIANQIRINRNFHEYNILLDNLEECHNIRLERTIPLGLSHYVLYTLTNTH